MAVYQHRGPRAEKGLSRQELADMMYVTRTAVARWENGTRLPDAMMIARLAEVLGVDINVLLKASAQSDEQPNVIMVDDNKIINGSLPIIEEVIPKASITGFTNPLEAVFHSDILADVHSLCLLLLIPVLLVRSH